MSLSDTGPQRAYWAGVGAGGEGWWRRLWDRKDASPSSRWVQSRDGKRVDAIQVPAEGKGEKWPFKLCVYVLLMAADSGIGVGEGLCRKLGSWCV